MNSEFGFTRTSEVCFTRFCITGRLRLQTGVINGIGKSHCTEEFVSRPLFLEQEDIVPVGLEMTR
jgi:hypothetical protein